MDVTKLIFQHVTPDVSERIGTVADLPPDEAARLMAAAIPAVLAMLLDMTGDEALEEAVREAPADLRALAAADSAALETASRDGLARGSALLGPACFAAFVAALGRHGGVDRDRMRRIAGLATTFSISGIADAGRARGLDADESLTMFSRQTGSVALALPADFAEEMAERRLLQGLGARAAEATAQARPAGGATNRPGAPALPAQPGSAWWRWVIPGTAMLVAIAVAIVFLAGPSVPPG